MVIDTAFSFKKQKDVKKWTSISEYYGVYHFSKNLTGIGFEIKAGPDTPLLDSLFAYGANQSEKDIRLDSSGHYVIHYSKGLFNTILNNDTSRTFYIYCTKGMTRATVENVLFGTTDCNTVLILKLSKIDTLRFGYPLIASKKLHEFIFTTSKGIQKGLVKYEAILNKTTDYKDSIISKQFAYNSQLFFAYSDDFKWFGTNKESKCLFPTRSVFRISGNSAKVVWVDDLDLFGIPCD
ncbi:hypothetical protein ACPPVU_16920 [Mucilaginibacter sp. McL0603]|uniref:hypothetical protein n=1 Tax=Mucilaginibacter sp. McL0603 TaxID=3415670 RepID=UPI003CE9319B